MSHAATNWAIRQKGLKPAAKIVLWHLCDRHHPDNGCFPMQTTLANDCEMSRSTLNLQLDKLEAMGLIRREISRDAGSKQQRPTRYFFAFEDEKAVSENETIPTKAVSEKTPKPCPKKADSRVLKSDSNSVREPLREPCVPNGDTHTDFFSEFWEAHPRPNDELGSEKLFIAAVAAGADPAHIVAAAVAYEADNKGNSRQYLKMSDNWLADERWKNHKPAKSSPKATDAEMLAYWAEKINGPGFIAPSSIKPTMARKLIADGLVTPEQMKSRGIAA